MTLRRAGGFGEIPSPTGGPPRPKVLLAAGHPNIEKERSLGLEVLAQPNKLLLVTLSSAPQSNGADDEDGPAPAKHVDGHVATIDLKPGFEKRPWQPTGTTTGIERRLSLLHPFAEVVDFV